MNKNNPNSGEKTYIYSTNSKDEISINCTGQQIRSKKEKYTENRAIK